MSFFEEIKKSFNIGESVKPIYRILWVGENAIYIEGIQSIKSYSKEKIELRIKNGQLLIEGEELLIKKYCLGDMAICGKIKKAERA